MAILGSMWAVGESYYQWQCPNLLFLRSSSFLSLFLIIFLLRLDMFVCIHTVRNMSNANSRHIRRNPGFRDSSMHPIHDEYSNDLLIVRQSNDQRDKR